MAPCCSVFCAQHRLAIPLSVAILVALAGCSRPPAAFVPPPPPEVTVATPQQQRVPQTLEFTGVTRGIETVEIRARVRGFLLQKLAQDGKRVKQGDLLFSIDPRTFEAAVQQARAELAAREADLKLAEVTLERTRQAGAANAIAKQELDRAEAQRDGTLAQVDLAKARVRTAELDLEFTQIRSPINGRIGFIGADAGDLVGASEPTLLARVINDEKIYATYDMDERTILEQRRINQNRRPGEDGRPNLPVRLALANDVGFPHVGQFDRADNAVNPQTGTVRVESIFDNKDGTILPGAFVRVQPQFGETDALTVPDVAVLADQRGRFVLVVGDGNKVERRDIRVGEVIDRRRIVLEGLDPAARVIVNGVQRARPGIEVRLAGSPAPAAPAPATK
jgi:RND family efflux transporter MFP subunit